MARNYVQVIGNIWMPNHVMCAMEYPLREYDIENMRNEEDNLIEREDIDHWLGKHAGDFSYIKDFSAWINGQDYPWQDEESEFTFIDCMGGDGD